MLCTDDFEQSTSDSVTTTYRLQDITDVHIMARLQEASEYRRVFHDDSVYTAHLMEVAITLVHISQV